MTGHGPAGFAISLFATKAPCFSSQDIIEVEKRRKKKASPWCFPADVEDIRRDMTVVRDGLAKRWCVERDD